MGTVTMLPLVTITIRNGIVESVESPDNVRVIVRNLDAVNSDCSATYLPDGKFLVGG